MMSHGEREQKPGIQLRLIGMMFLLRVLMGLMRLLRRRATYLPGAFACKIFPDFLSQISLPKTIIAVTGTNGKTTVCNLLVDCFQGRGIPLIHNRLGSNTIEGVVTALAAGLDWRGRSKKDFAILEIDELSARRVFPQMEPDYLLVTNLLRDSYQRNAHPDFIFNILNQFVPAKTRLILNGEDPISSRLKPQNERRYFAISSSSRWPCALPGIVCDLHDCPYCGQALECSLTRFNHIGYWHCEQCGFTNPRPDYLLTQCDEQKKEICIEEAGGASATYRLLGKSCVDWYNNLAALSVLRELGWSSALIAEIWALQSIIKSRHDSRELCGLPVDVLLGKALNPVASSRMIDFICHQSGRKAVVLFNTYMLKDGLNLENTGWLYEIDYERLNREDVVQIIIGSRRAYDYKVRLELAGIKPAIIRLYEDLKVPGEALELRGIERICVLHDINNMAETDAFLKRVEQLNAVCSL